VVRIETATLTMIKSRFVGREAAVELAFAASESFRGLCRDYLTCVAALTRWRESPSEDARRRSAEYAELVAELTREMEAHLRSESRSS
jgi:hypothetical protein